MACRQNSIDDPGQIVRHLLFVLSVLLINVVSSNHLEQVISKFSQAIDSAIRTSHPRCDLLPHMLHDLAEWERRPSCLTTEAYKWCSVISRNYSDLVDGKNLLFLSLEIGFRQLDPKHPQIPAELTHTKHHRRMADIVFESGDEEVIADLLHARTSRSGSHKPPSSLNACARHIVGLRPSSPRLRRLTIRAVGLIGYQRFAQVGMEGFFELLNQLGAGVEDMDGNEGWTTFLLDTIQSSEDVQHLSLPYWELLTELLILESQRLEAVAWSPRIMASLEGNQEWDQERGKLECWMGIVWMAWPPETGSTAEGEVRDATLSLFRQRPGAAQKLEEWMERWSERSGKAVPESFRQVCEQVRHEAAQQAGP